MPLESEKWAAIFALSMFSFVNRLHGTQVVPCYFVFGDSLTDPGNNNRINTFAKANYPPYGIDFPYGPTGRFCNGRTIVDLIVVEYLGFSSYIVPFADAESEDVLRGVNYASGGAGILDETGEQFGNISRFTDQVKHHAEIVSKIMKMFGGNDNASALAHLSKCLYHVQIGNNDYIGNYFYPELYNSSSLYNEEQFADHLVQNYLEQIKTLYHLGARKLMLVGASPCGCTPNIRAHNPPEPTPCIEHFHVAIRTFNEKLKSLVDYLNRVYSNAKFIYIDGFNSLHELVAKPLSNGFAVSNMGCCGIGPYGGFESCQQNQIPCRLRNLYLFWDPFHLTDAGNFAVTRKLLNNDSAPSFTYPMTILELAKL